jgi:hypothetical protein
MKRKGGAYDHELVQNDELKRQERERLIHNCLWKGRTRLDDSAGIFRAFLTSRPPGFLHSFGRDHDALSTRTAPC